MQADSKQGTQGLSSLKDGSTDSGSVESYYDDWARSYEQTLRGWHYQAPEDATNLLLAHLEPGARVLDVGCGTGLFGEVLSQRASCHLQGIDISAEALKQAEARGVYGALLRHDLQQLPLPVARHGEFSGVFGMTTSPPAKRPRISSQLPTAGSVA